MKIKTIILTVALFFSLTLVSAQAVETVVVEPEVAVVEHEVVAENSSISAGVKFIAAGVAVGLACIGSGVAVGKIGAAAMGAMAEDPSLSGKALPFVGLAEGICLWGFLVALLIIFQ